METIDARPLLVSRDSGLLDDLTRLCATAAVDPEVVHEPHRARQSWIRATCVLVGDDCADEVSSLAFGRRDNVVLVARPPESAATWRQGVALRADHVAVLPDSEGWIIDHLTDTSGPRRATARVVGVIGAHGGAGASTLAVCLAMAAAAGGESAVVVDADPLAGGIELLVGCEATPGLRWGDLLGVEGRITGAALRAALPSVDGLSVLSATGLVDGQLDQGPVRAVLQAAHRGFQHVVVDLPRRTDVWMAEVAATIDSLVVVTTADVRAAASAGQIVRMATACFTDTRVVVRTSPRSPLDAADVAASLALPLLGVVATRRSRQRSISDGLGPVLSRRETRRLLAMVRSLGIPHRDRSG